MVNGDAAVAAAFSAQPWAHLVFTGSTAVGKAVMAAAAANLVPLTLELGGKSPVLVGRSADIGNAAERIIVGKAGNGGQLCVSPDVVWLPREQLEAFIGAALRLPRGPVPGCGSDVVAVVNERHHRASTATSPTPARAARASRWPATGPAPRAPRWRCHCVVVIRPPTA